MNRLLHCLLRSGLLAPAATPAPAETVREWLFSSGAQGWTGSGVTGTTVTPQGIEFDAVAPDPQWTSPSIDLRPTSENAVLIRMSSTADSGDADLFWGSSFTADRRVRFAVTTDGVMRDYVIPIRNMGSSSRMRLDPTGGSGRIVIERIALLGTPPELQLDNGVVDLRMDLATAGGAITWLSPSGDTRNLINNHDRGRQVQQSYYAGQSLDRQADGQSPNWSPWPWNPIQVGDTLNNSSTVLEASVTDGVAHVKTTPMLWDMNDEPAQCFPEQWTRLDGNVAKVTCRLVSFRDDAIWTQIVTRDQELPAVYTITQLPRLMAYVGESAWTNAPLTEITRIVIPGNESFPWNAWPSAQYPGSSFEPWAATVDANDWGVGVFTRVATRMLGGQVGPNGGGELDGATKYISPLRQEALAPDAVYEHDFELILGTLDEIRAHVYASMGPDIWRFDTAGDFQGWTFPRDTVAPQATESGLVLGIAGIDPIMQSSEIAVAARLFPFVHVRMRNQTASTTMQVFWTNEFGGPGASRVATLSITANDLVAKDYVFDLRAVPGWVGTLRGPRLDPVSNVTSGQVRIEGIAITNSAESPFTAAPAGSAWMTLSNP